MLKLYEAMFVVDSNKSRQDHDKVVEELTAVIQKGGGEPVNCEKWEERKLAYPLKHHKRGTYYLSHFRSQGDAIGRIERAAQLNETVLRVMVTVDEDGESMPVYADTSDDDPRGRRGGPPRGSSRHRSAGPGSAPVAPAERKPKAAAGSGEPATEKKSKPDAAASAQEPAADSKDAAD